MSGGEVKDLLGRRGRRSSCPYPVTVGTVKRAGVVDDDERSMVVQRHGVSQARVGFRWNMVQAWSKT